MKPFSETAMDKPDYLDEIINELEPEMVPLQYMIVAKVQTIYGEDLVLTKEELEDLMDENPEIINSVRVMLDMKAIRDDINKISDAVFQTMRRNLLQ
jgi:hypothetical protein